MRPKAKNASRGLASGFTLVEVLLALVILGTGITVLVATTARSLAVARRAKEYQDMRYLLARLELTHPLQLEEEIQPGTEEGIFEPPYDEYRWQRTIEQVEAFELLPGVEADDRKLLYQVNVLIFRQRPRWAAGRRVVEEVTTYLYYPGEREGGSFSRQP
ncbi:MAG TPA: prepilin-type N-terminal cleavage/methylation domain-containing protein [Kiritimatiellae bacterium]|nr:prepilin-type N-terminal cleavage/methylation domain-containing protein [Kiritimatiellia bacterium]